MGEPQTPGAIVLVDLLNAPAVQDVGDRPGITVGVIRSV